MNSRENLAIRFGCSEGDIKVALLKIFYEAQRNQVDNLNYSFTEEQDRLALLEDGRIKEPKLKILVN